MNQQDKKPQCGDWIRVGENRLPVYITRVINAENICGGYYQNSSKVIEEEFLLINENWKFKYSGPSGSYLKGAIEEIIKKGPAKC